MNSNEKRVLRVVSRVALVSEERIMSRSRDHIPTQARFVVQAILVLDMRRSCNGVARMFGRDHSSICNAIRRVRRDMQHGGPCGDMIKAAREVLAADVPAQALEPSLPLHHTLAPRQAKRVTRHGWVEADGALVVAP